MFWESFGRVGTTAHHRSVTLKPIYIVFICSSKEVHIFTPLDNGLTVKNRFQLLFFSWVYHDHQKPWLWDPNACGLIRFQDGEPKLRQLSWNGAENCILIQTLAFQLFKICVTARRFFIITFNLPLRFFWMTLHTLYGMFWTHLRFKLFLKQLFSIHIFPSLAKAWWEICKFSSHSSRNFSHSSRFVEACGRRWFKH